MFALLFFPLLRFSLVAPFCPLRLFSLFSFFASFASIAAFAFALTFLPLLPPFAPLLFSLFFVPSFPCCGTHHTYVLSMFFVFGSVG